MASCYLNFFWLKSGSIECKHPSKMLQVFSMPLLAHLGGHVLSLAVWLTRSRDDGLSLMYDDSYFQEIYPLMYDDSRLQESHSLTYDASRLQENLLLMYDPSCLCRAFFELFLFFCFPAILSRTAPLVASPFVQLLAAALWVLGVQLLAACLPLELRDSYYCWLYHYSWLKHYCSLWCLGCFVYWGHCRCHRWEVFGIAWRLSYFFLNGDWEHCRQGLHFQGYS